MLRSIFVSLIVFFAVDIFASPVDTALAGIDSIAIRSMLDQTICIKKMITNADYSLQSTRDMSKIIGTGDGKGGLSNVQTSIINPAVSINATPFSLYKKEKLHQAPKVRKTTSFLNFGAALKFNDPISKINIRNPNIEAEVSIDYNLMINNPGYYYRSECDKYAPSYKDFMTPYIYHKRYLGYISRKYKSDLRLKENNSDPTQIDILNQKVTNDSLLINTEELLIRSMDTIHDKLIASAPFNVKNYHWFSFKYTNRLQSFAVYDDRLAVSDSTISRRHSDINSLSISYNLYHYVPGRFRMFQFHGNIYFRLGIDLSYNNAADNGKNGPYSVQVIDTLSNSSQYVKNQYSVFSAKAFDKILTIFPHADLFVTGNQKRIGLHVLTNYKYSMKNNVVNGNVLNAGLGLFASVNTGTGNPVNFEFTVTATDLLSINSKTKLAGIVSPEVKLQLPFSFLK